MNTVDRKFCILHETLIQQNIIASMVRNFSDKLNFIFNVVIDAYKTHGSVSDRFNPNPIVYFKEMYGNELEGEELLNFATIIHGDNFKFLETMELFFRNNNKTDDQFINFIGKLDVVTNKDSFVKLLYFFISSNQVTFTFHSSFLSSNIWKIQNTTEKEQDFSKIPGKTKMLFHGTNPQSIYSIMRNGLQTLSNTSLMTNAARHGEGIYASDDINVALSYSKCDGYILILKVKNSNQKTDGIYLQTEKEVLICGLISIKGSVVLSSLASINLKTKAEQVYNQTVIIAPITIPVNSSEDLELLTMNISQGEPLSDETIMSGNRIRIEVQRLFESKNKSSIINKVNFYDPNNNRTPLLIELIPASDTLLYSDCKKYNIPGILIAFYFEKNGNEMYPFVPPKVRIVRPKFIKHTGRITDGGSICASILYKGDWSPANNISGIINSLIALISYDNEKGEGKMGRIDGNRLNEEYNWNEFLASRDLIATIHTWEK